MPTIEFAASAVGAKKIVDVPEGGALVDVCDEYLAPVPFSCRSASCATCHIEVLEGAELLEPPDAEERVLLGLLQGLPNARLACQARVKPGRAGSASGRSACSEPDGLAPSHHRRDRQWPGYAAGGGDCRGAREADRRERLARAHRRARRRDGGRFARREGSRRATAKGTPSASCRAAMPRRRMRTSTSSCRATWATRGTS